MAEAQLRHIRIAELDRTHNVRRSLGDLSELVASIRSVGVLTPVTVIPKASGDGWRLVAGHRRTAAAEEVGLETVPALVHTAADASERLLATLVENLQRLDLDPVEEASGYRSLVDAGWAQAEVARRVGRSRAHVSRRLRILTLPAEVQAMVSEGAVTVEHAYTLSQLVGKEVPAEEVTVAAKSDPEYAARKLLEVETDERLEHRRRKLERGGVTVVVAKRLWQAKYDRRVGWMNLDGEHSTEPCHMVVLHLGDYGITAVDETAVCTDVPATKRTGTLRSSSAQPVRRPMRSVRGARSGKRSAGRRRRSAWLRRKRSPAA
ncbi:MAG: ParB/RepB/Spo0J family partition protein [Chloroflexi bacterium]|nr:ParB/RepB/Spo0J family partition protein [Chloroflexota bacterium]